MSGEQPPPAFSFDASGVEAACKLLESRGASNASLTSVGQHSSRPPHTLVVRRPPQDACTPRTLGSGNWLSVYFAFRTLALLHGAAFHLESACALEEHAQLLAWLPTAAKAEQAPPQRTASASPHAHLCAAAATGDFHSARDGVARFAARWGDEIRAAVLRWNASAHRSWPRDAPGLDSTAIHVRCGDLMGARADPRRSWYGLLPLSAYAPVWEAGGARVRSVGIVTASLDPFDCNMSQWKDGLPATSYIRRRDCGPDKKHQEDCGAIVRNISRHLFRASGSVHQWTGLHELSPPPAVVVHSGESLMAATTRLALAEIAVCNPSTFCLWPTLAARTGFLVASPLIPADALASFAPRVRTIRAGYLGFDRMSHMTVDAIVQYLRDT